MIRSHKIALDPTDKQRTAFAKAAGCARFAWNWALEEWQRQRQLGEQSSEMSLRRQLNAMKKEYYPWMLDTTKTAVEQAVRNLGTAFTNFFSKRARYPHFKKKGIRDSFRAANSEKFSVDGNRIRLPVIGWVRMFEPLRFEGRLLSATVSRRAQRWYVSVQVEVEDKPVVRKNHGTVGVDLGISHLATLSTGEHIEGPKPLKVALIRLRMLNKSVSRKKKGSNNQQKAKMKLARQHARVADVRKDFLHKLTTDLIRRFDTIAIEDLNVRGMVKNRHLSRAISDMGFGEFRRQLTYKAAMYGATVAVADRFYPSSKTCSDCGHVVENLPLSVREWSCSECGVVHDRDVNAAMNLKNMAASSAVTACGEGRSGAQTRRRAKRTSTKQEPNAIEAIGIGG